MKQHILNTIIENLNKDHFAVVRINNIDNGNIICNNYGRKEMIEAAGGVNEYFNELYHSGVKNISIVRRRRNGKGCKSTGEPVEIFSFNSTGQLQNDIPMHTPPIQNQTATNPDNSGQLFGNMQGLFGGVHPMTAAYKLQRYDEIFQENLAFKEEVKSLKKENEELERQKMKDEYDINRKAGNKELFETIANIAGPAFAGLITKGEAVAEPPGMAAPAMQATSPIKQQLFDLVNANNDNIANYQLQTLHLMLTNADFGKELMKLIEQYKPSSSDE